MGQTQPQPQAQSQAVFGDWVARARRAIDLTQHELADQVGCSVSALRKIESGERRPSREIAELLATNLAIPADQRAAFVTLARRDAGPPALPHVIEAASPALTTPEFVSRSVDAPPLSAAPPAPPTPLVGREHELATVARLLLEPSCRLITLVGPGGIGKSRLAHHVSVESARGAGFDLCYVDLTTIQTPELMAQTIAAAAGAQTLPNWTVRESLYLFLQDRRVLFVLDNLEHLLDGVDLISGLLQSAPHVKVLATSRERLNLHGEWVLEVQGLPIPETEEGFDESSAVRLFLQCARRVRVDFTPDRDDKAAIARICRDVEGMPLAIELAAGWVGVLTCQEIGDEIARDPHILASSARDLPNRHRSMQAVFDQSWRLLSENDQYQLARLSAFRGGFDRELASRVANVTLANLSSLVARSLVRRSGPHRFDMHELVRQFCRERLVESGQADEAFHAHASALHGVALEARRNLFGLQQMEWLERLQVDLGNIRAALEWCTASGAVATGLQIASSLMAFWYQRDLQAEGRSWIEGLLAVAREEESAGMASPFDGQAIDPMLRAEALTTVGYLAYEMGDFAEAGDHLREALRMPEIEENPNAQATALVVLGQVHGSQGAYAEARAVLERALALTLNDIYAQRRRASALMALGDVTGLSGDDEHAQFLYAASTAIYRDVGDLNAVAYSLRKWGWSALRCGEIDSADGLTRESLALNQQTGSKIGAIACLVSLGAIAQARGGLSAAGCLVAAAQGLMERLQVRLRPIDEVGLARVLQELGASTEGRAALHSDCRALTLDEAIARLTSR